MARSLKNRRKKKYIRPDLQLKVVFITFFAATFLLLVNFQLDLAGLWSLSSKLGVAAGGALQALEETRSLLIEKFVITVAIGVPLTVLIGILYSFRISGPIHRFRRYFQDLGAGRWDARCQLRKGDALQDVCHVINESMDSVSARLLEDLRLLQEANAFLDPAVPEDDGSAARRRMLRDRITNAIALHEQRLGLREQSEQSGRPGGTQPAAAAPVPERRLEPTT